MQPHQQSREPRVNDVVTLTTGSLAGARGVVLAVDGRAYQVRVHFPSRRKLLVWVYPNEYRLDHA